MDFKGVQTEQKLRGGYYTPDDLAEFLTRWAAGVNPKSVLEPSCGNGVFFEKIATHMGDPYLAAFEINKEDANKACRRASESNLKNANVHADDFLGWAFNAINNGKQFDAILGNPPFIRYQFLPSVFQLRAANIFNALNCKFTKHTNAWVSFVLACFALLRPGGRLAMVVPAEIIHVMHASSLRTYLSQTARRIVIVDPEEIWFSDTLQGAVLLLAEKRRGPDDRAEGLGIYSVSGRRFVHENPELIFNTPLPVNGRTVEGKWTKALLEQQTRSLLDDTAQLPSVHSFEDVAAVDVGIITGANKFFLVTDQIVNDYGLEEWAHPMFGRSEHCPGVIYDEAQHLRNAAKGSPTNFLWFKDGSVESSLGTMAYIAMGEDSHLHRRYKCRIRRPWYVVPSVYSTEIGMLKRSHDSPRLILNELRAYTTDTSYRVRIKRGTAEQLVFSFVNPLTALSAELEGRHYGGGVLELVPSEIERLLIPIADDLNPDVGGLDDLIRSKRMEYVLQRQGRIVLGEIGMTESDQNELMNAWMKLRARRQRNSIRNGLVNLQNE